MKKCLLIGIISLLSICEANAQSVLSEWEGSYEGLMIVGSNARENDSVDVQFYFQPLEGDSVWTYKLIFTSGKYGEITKDYLVRRDGDSESDFVLDEQDGIIIEMTLMNDCFYDMFEVMGNLYSSTLRKVSDDTILFDLLMAVKKDGTVTSSEEGEDGKVFEVTSYKPVVHQTINLKRTN